jgi:hypothetical protein
MVGIGQVELGVGNVVAVSAVNTGRFRKVLVQAVNAGGVLAGETVTFVAGAVTCSAADHAEVAVLTDCSLSLWGPEVYAKEHPGESAPLVVVRFADAARLANVAERGRRLEIEVVRGTELITVSAAGPSRELITRLDVALTVPTDDARPATVFTVNPAAPDLVAVSAFARAVAESYGSGLAVNSSLVGLLENVQPVALTAGASAVAAHLWAQNPSRFDELADPKMVALARQPTDGAGGGRVERTAADWVTEFSALLSELNADVDTDVAVTPDPSPQPAPVERIVVVQHTGAGAAVWGVFGTVALVVMVGWGLYANQHEQQMRCALEKIGSIHRGPAEIVTCVLNGNL